MTAEERAFIGNAWFRDGLAEHASVASFAQFVLLAMQHAAPPDLLLGAIQAMKDEVRHAQLCFGVAERFLGRKVGPGPLSLENILLDGQSFEAVVEATVVEGCVEETIAAAYAQQARDQVCDPALRTILSEIAEDELRHSDLAWAFVEWALGRQPQLERVVLNAFHAALSRPMAADGDDGMEAAERHGIVTRWTKCAVRRQTIESVILPRIASMLGVDAVSPDLIS